MKLRIVVSLALCLPLISRAVDGSWTVDAGGTWSTSANWLGGVAATGANATAYFTNTITASRVVTNDIPTSVAIGRLSFAPGAANTWTVEGNPLALTLAAAGSATVTVSSGSAAIRSAISGGTNILKLGAGTLVMSGTNSYVGGTTINAGFVSVAADENLGATNGNVTLNGGNFAVTASFTNRAPRALAVNVAGVLDVAPGATYLLGNNQITGAQTLTKSNTGTLVISQTSGNNPYTGTLTVNGGTVLLSGSVGDGVLRGNATVNNGGTLRYGLNNPAVNTAIITVNAGGIFDLAGFGDFIGFIAGAGSITNNNNTLSLDLGAATNTFSGSIAGTGALTVRANNGPGLQILSGTNTYTGSLTLQAGTLGVSTYENIGPAGKVVSFAGGALRITGTVVSNLDNYAVVWTNFNGALDIATAANVFTVTNVIGGPGTFTKLGTGVVSLAAANTYTGTTLVTGGRLELQAGASLASRLILVQFGATFVPRYDTALPGVPSLYVSQAGGFGRIDLTSVTNLPVTSFTIDGTMQAAGTWGATGSGATFTNDSIFSGTGVLNVLGGFTAVDANGSWGVNASGNWGDTNNWIDGMVAYGTNATAFFTNALTADRVANNGFTTLPIGNLVFGSPTNNWSITNNTIRLDVLSGTPTITVATNTATIQSVLSGAQGLTKAGPGTLVVSSSGSYSGATTVAAGTLQYTGNGTPYQGGTQPGQITVNSNASLSFNRSDALGAHNSYANALVTLEAGSLVQNTGVAFTTIRNLTLNGGELRANGGNSTTWPAFQLKGTTTVSGASASLISAYAVANGQHQVQLGNNITNGTTTFDIADVTGNDAADLVVNAGFSDGRAPASPYPYVTSGFNKRGPGTMRLGGSSVNRGTNTLETGAIVLAGGATLNGPLVMASGTTVVCESGPGLLGEYYLLGTTSPVAGSFAAPFVLNTHLAALNPSLLYNLAMTITNFDFGTGGANMPVNYMTTNVNFEGRWAGKFVAPVSGSYYFGMNSDDGSYLWIDGTNVITKNGAGGFGTNTITLDAGLHDITFGFFQGTGAYGLYCDLSIAGGPTNRLSATNLISGPAVVSLDGGAGASLVLSNTVLTVGQTNDTTFAGTITTIGDGRLRKLGTGTLALTATNSLTGVTLGGGRVRIMDDAPIGGMSSALSFEGGILQLAGGATNIDTHPANWTTFNGGIDVAVSGQVVTVTNQFAGPGSLTKFGPGALLLTANNNLTGAVTVAGGQLVLTGATNTLGALTVSGGATGSLAVLGGRTSLGTNTVIVGAAASDRGALVISNDLTSLRLLVGNNSTAAGAVIQNAGNVSVGPALAGVDVLSLGLGGGGYGYYQMNGGSLTAGQIAPGGNSTNVSGVFDFFAGTVNVSAASGWIVLGWQKANAALNIFDAQITNTPSGNDVTLGFTANGGSFGMINLIGSNALLNTLGGGATRTFNLMNSTGNLLSVANLNGGRLIANRVRQNANGPTVLGFNGGTLQANGGITQTAFLQGLTSTYVYAGGAIIDSSNSTISIGQPLLAPADNGVASIPVVSGGAGYVGAPVVTISGGGGTGATAIAQVNLTLGHPAFGQLTNLLITSAGASYSTAPTIALVGGGALVPATLGTATLAANVSGGLTKRGTGTLTLNATNTYGGVTTVEQGALLLGNALAASTGTIVMASTATAIGVTFAPDQTFLNALGTRLSPTSQPASFMLGTNNAAALDFGAAGLTNWTLGVAVGVFTNTGTIVMPSTNLYLGAGNGTLVHLAPLGNGTNVFIGAYGVKPTVVIGSTNASYVGGIEAVNGTLKAGASNAFGGASATVRINAGTTLDVGGQNLGTVQVFVQGSGASNNGAIVNTVVDQVNALQKVTLTGDTLIGGANRWDIRTGAISPSLDLAGFTLTKTNGNYVALVNSAVSDGNIVHAQGTLSIEANATITGGVGTIAVQTNAILQFWAQSGPITRAITLNAGTLLGGSGLNAIGSPITLAGPTNVFSALYGATLAPTGSIAGPGALLKTGVGLVKLAQPSSYTGRTLVNSGLLELASADAVNGTLPGTSDVLLYGAGTLQLDYGNALAGTNSKAVTVATGGVLTVSNGVVGRIAGAFALAGGALGGGTPDALYGNWLIDTNVPVSGLSFITAPRSQLNGTIAFDVTNGTTLTSAGTLEDPGLGTAGTGTLVKTGGGSMVISMTNSYGGATEIAQGTLALAQGLPVSGAALWLDAADAKTISTDSSNLVVQWSDKSGYGRHAAQVTQVNRPAFTNNALVKGLPVVHFSGGVQVLPLDLSFFANTSYSIFAVEGRTTNGASAYFLGMNGTGTNNNQLHVGYRSDTQFTFAQYGNDLNAAVSAYTGQTFRTWAGICDTNNGHFIWMNGTNTASGTNKIPFGVSLPQGGVGRGNNSSFNGDVAEIVVYPRALSAAERQAVESYLTTKWMGSQVSASSNLLPVATPLRIASGATFDLAGVGQNVGSLSDLAGGGGRVTNSSAAPATLVVGNNNGNAAFSGSIVSGAGLLSLTKTGSGTQILHGINTYVGPTAIDAGSLILNGAVATGDVTVASGATLGGTGTVAGIVVNMGLVAPGSSPGTLTVGALLQTAASELAIEIASAAPGGYDRVLANTASLNGTLTVTTNGYTPVAGDSFAILTAPTYTGLFAATNLPALAGGLGWKLQYDVGAVVLSVTGAPPATGYDLAATVITNGLSGYQDDADGDGYANLLEYVTGGSLTNAGVEAKMQGTRTNGLLALRFNRDTNAIDATIVVEGSTSAANSATWLGIATNIGGSWGAATNVVSAGTNSPLSETVYDTDSGTNRFLRLRVTRP